MVPLKFLIVDDEDNARENLRYFLEKESNTEIIGEASSVAEGVKAIQLLQPDVVFLDIEMEDGTGFDLLDQFRSPEFRIVFITAHDEFAIRAFKYNAIDYLLKPTNSVELSRVIGKLKKIQQPDWLKQVSGLLAIVKEKKIEKILLPTSEGLNVVNLSKIIYIQSEGSYCDIFLLEDERLGVSKNMKDLEALLEPSNFFRSHQSFLVNFTWVKKLLKEDGGMILMGNGTKIPLARRRKEEFILALSKHIN